MRRLWAALSLVVLVAVLGLASGCVSSSQQDARTPAGSPTVSNSALQTDSQGHTITAPAATSPAATSPAAGGTTSKGGGAAPAGNAAAGEQVFAKTCTSCHLGNGKQAGGVGPQLAGLGLTADRIHTQVVNGGGPMPPGLVSGTDLDNVVAYVVSIQ